ncbi:hypothetical protein PCANB_002497 [Pneumocystis canis]|nr:hypothetical protein PCANB_002497 [Pneumocystis canis]
MNEIDETFFNILLKYLNIRIGRLKVMENLKVITPNFLICSSRGTIPHMTPDHVKNSCINGIYVALEDFIEYPAFKEKKEEKELKPFLSCKGSLRDFVSVPLSNYLILGTRKSVFSSKKPNISEAIRIMTSGGSQLISIKDIVNFYGKLKSEIVVSPVDIPDNISGNKRLLKMIERTKSWLNQLLEKELGSFIFASVPPVSKELLLSYFLTLESNLSKIHGLALYNSEQSKIIPNSLKHLPLLLMEPIYSPHLILNCIENSIDLFIFDFISEFSNLGVAFIFQFPPLISSEKNDEPLGIDMLSEEHKTSLVPLLQKCECFTCKFHHRAYVRHLLVANELLGFILLQLHNISVINVFFSNIQASIMEKTFLNYSKLFKSHYQTFFPKYVKKE